MNRTRKKRITSAFATVLFAICALLFFGVLSPFHLVSQEQLQLFEGTSAYFLDTVGIPGGFSDWIARFLTQFFFYAWSGAAVVALLLCALQITVARMSRADTHFAYALSFVPSLLLCAFLCLRFAQVNVIVALLLALLAAAAVSKVRNDALRRVLAIVLIPVLYWLVGPMAVVYAATVLAGEKKPVLQVLAVVVAVLCPLAAWTFLNYPLSRLLYGLNYYKVHTEMPCLPWLAALVACAAVCLRSLVNRVTMKWAQIAVPVIVAAGGVALVLCKYDPQTEKSLKYDILTGKRAWNALLSEAVKSQPQTYAQIASVNLALCKTGHLGGHMFDYQQDGVEGLIPNTKATFREGLTIAEIYWQTGMVNNARRYCYEALAAVPDFQKSAPLYKLLAEICIVNERYEAARKYLTSLSHTIFYRAWADERLAKFEDLMDIAMTEEYAQKHLDRYKKGEDYIFDYNSTAVTLAQLLEENPGNVTALNYLLAWHLLNKDLGAFVACCPFEGYTSSVPKAYQEAMTLYLDQFGNVAEDMPSFIAKNIASRSANYRRDFDSNRPMEFIRDMYGDTYWFYYDFK